MDSKETGKPRYMRSDDVRNLNCSNFHTEKENKSMVYSDILIITLMLYYKLVSTRDVGSSYIGVWRRLQRVCTFAWPCQSFCISRIQSMNVEEDSKNYRHLVPLGTPK